MERIAKAGEKFRFVFPIFQVDFFRFLCINFLLLVGLSLAGPGSDSREEKKKPDPNPTLKQDGIRIPDDKMTVLILLFLSIFHGIYN